MACMEHSCFCGWATFNNERGPFVCPKCGGDLMHTFDEDLRDHYGPYDDETGEDEDGN